MDFLSHIISMYRAHAPTQELSATLSQFRLYTTGINEQRTRRHINPIQIPRPITSHGLLIRAHTVSEPIQCVPARNVLTVQRCILPVLPARVAQSADGVKTCSRPERANVAVWCGVPIPAAIVEDSLRIAA